MIFFPALVLVLLGLPNLAYSFSYDSAIYAAQKGNWQDAHATLNSIVTNKPDNADVVYDAGVAAYTLGSFSQAAAYFVRAAELAHHDKNLQFRAHFNAGNACVDDKNLPCALEQYDKALALEPDNEHARHNRDRVAQMLEQQEQQQQKENDQKDDQKKDDKQEKDKQDQNGDDQQQQNQSGDDKQDNNQQGNEQSGDQKDKQNEGSDKKSQGEQGDNADGDSDDTQRKEHGNKKQQQKNSEDNKKRNGNQELDKKTKDQQSKPKNQQGNEHNKTPEKQNITDNKSNASSAAGQDGQADGDDKKGEIALNDPWLLQVLNNQEQKDKAINKQLMEAKVRQHQQGGKNGQNCW